MNKDDDDDSNEPTSQYDSIYARGELQDKGLGIHDLLASEYGEDEVAVKKMKLKRA